MPSPKFQPQIETFDDMERLQITLAGADTTAMGFSLDAKMHRIAADLCDAAEEQGWSCAPPHIDRQGRVVLDCDTDFQLIARSVRELLDGRTY